MKKFIKFVLMLSLLAFVFTGCRTAPIQNITDNSFVPLDAKNVHLDSVGRSIMRAGLTLGWNMQKTKEGLIIGTIHVRDHMAQVKIPYTTHKYSILYNDSQNLKYDAKKNVIHSNYNGWVENLNKAIQLQLSTL